MLLASLAVALASPLGAQQAASQAGPTSRTVQGRVIDALHGSPVPRALVHLNARAMLTDAQGRFSFAQFSDAQAYVSVLKPGYTADGGADGPAMTKVADLDATLELRMFPDALITGTVTARDGSALAGVGLQLFRANYDLNGITAAQLRHTITDTHGNYRFQEPAGKYRIVSRYVGSLPETGQAVLATGFPGASSGMSSGYFSLVAGEEKRINLRPATGTAVAVELKVDGMENEDRPGRLRVSVEAEGGVSFRHRRSRRVHQAATALRCWPERTACRLRPGAARTHSRVQRARP